MKFLVRNVASEYGIAIVTTSSNLLTIWLTAGALSLGIVTPVVADAVADCNAAKAVDTGILGCSAIIRSGATEKFRIIQAYGRRGQLYLQRTDYDRAIADLDKAIALGGRQAILYLSRGVALSLNGDHAKALPDINRAIQLNPKDAKALAFRADAYVRINDYNSAIADFTSAIALNPRDVPMHFRRGMAFLATEQVALAIADFDAITRIDRAASSGYAGRGLAYIDKGDEERALAEFGKMQVVDPTSLMPYLNRALIHANHARYREAALECDQALVLQPVSDIANRCRGYIKYYSGDFTGAATTLLTTTTPLHDMYSLLLGYLAARHSNGNPIAELASKAETVRIKRTTDRLVQVFQGRESVESVVAGAKGTSERCEIGFLAGVWYGIGGFKKEAVDALQGVVDRCPKSLAAYAGAVAELKRVDAK
jgi:tetratricopeptide (TPR) repeat protein